MKQYLPRLAIFAAALAVSACGQSKPEEVGGFADPLKDQLAKAKPVALPPAVKQSRTYRCGADLVYVDFLSDNVTANLRTEKTGAPTVLKAEADGSPFKADGYELDGTGTSVKLTTPAKSGTSCKA